MTPEQLEAYNARTKNARVVRFDENAPEEQIKRKYRNKPTQRDNFKFASQAEAKRYEDLKMLESAGAIEGLRLQPRYQLIVCGVKVCTYVADFAYRNKGQQSEIVEDVKGMLTPVYKLKKKLMLACHGIEITEIT